MDSLDVRGGDFKSYGGIQVMANYTQVTETLWVVEPQNLKEAIYLRYLQLRKKGRHFECCFW